MAPPNPDALQLSEAEARADYYKRYRNLLWDYQDLVQRQDVAIRELREINKRSTRMFWVSIGFTVVNFALFIHAITRI